jgi:hypothetical protein
LPRTASFHSLLGVSTLRCFLFLFGCFFATACTHLSSTHAPDRDPATLREIFVVQNFNDNHRLAQHLVFALRARGFVAQAGPRTLLPPTAQAILHYEDRWAWDFGEHMVYLRLTLHDLDAVQPFATATRTRFIARSTDLETVLPPLVATLLAPTPR